MEDNQWKKTLEVSCTEQKELEVVAESGELKDKEIETEILSWPPEACSKSEYLSLMDQPSSNVQHYIRNKHL